MQGRRSGLDSFPETFDLNQGSFRNNNSTDRSASWHTRLSPDESRLSNHMLEPHDGNINCMSAANNRAQSNRGWDHGESSSSGNNMQEQPCDGDSKTRLAWYSSSGSCSGTDVISEDWSSEPSNIRSTSYVGNQVTDRSQNMQNSSSTRASLNLGSNHGHVRSGYFGTEQIQTFYASSSSTGTSSGSSSTSSENNDASGPSFGTLGSSCKRKAHEGTSGHFDAGGSSNSNQPMENIMQHPIPGCCTAPGNLGISSGPPSVSCTNHLEQLNSRSGVGTSRVRPGRFLSSSVQGIAENPARNFALRSNPGHRESVPFDTSRGTSVGHSSVYAAQPQSQPIPNTNSLELISPMTLPMNPSNQPLVHVNETRGTHSNPWNGSFGSRRGSSSSFFLSGERGSGTHEDVNIRSSLRNNPEYPVIVPAPETRDILEDQIDWSFTPGTSLSSRNYSSGSRIGPSSGGRSSSTSLPHRTHTSQDQQRLLEAVPWIPFPRIESDSGTERSAFALLPLASSSSDEMATVSHAQYRLDRRSAGFLMDMPGDDTNGSNVLAAVEGRHRLVCDFIEFLITFFSVKANGMYIIVYDSFGNLSRENCS